MLKLGVLCSGGLGFKVLTEIGNDVEVAFVMTDKGSTGIIDYCDSAKIPCFIGNPRGGRGYEHIRSFAVDVIASVNYLFLIENDIIEHPEIIAFNIHGSLLPKYRGRTPHVWAIINNENETGISAHRIEVGCDTGALIEQIKVPISEKDTGADVLKKYEAQYLPLLWRVIDKIKNNKLVLTPQHEELATYFPKRTPEDGAISWDWQKERIRNWVRAQADPYPGAFGYYDGIKITIDAVSYSQLGFKSTTPNGTILKTSPKLVIKTPNGAINLEKIRAKSRNFQVGKCFENENRK